MYICLSRHSNIWLGGFVGDVGQELAHELGIGKRGRDDSKGSW